MGCSNSKSTTTTTTNETMMSSKTGEATQKEQKQHQQQQQQKQEDQHTHEYPQSEAFSIPFENVNATDAAKKPPKRLQELLTSAEESAPLTLAELQEKQERADQRRQELLAEKLATIQRNTQMLMMHSENVASTLTANVINNSDVGSGGGGGDESYRKRVEQYKNEPDSQ